MVAQKKVTKSTVKRGDLKPPTAEQGRQDEKNRAVSRGLAKMERAVAKKPAPAKAEYISLPLNKISFKEGARATPVYRPEKRGGVWCLYDVNNGELRMETFDNKGEAKVFAGRLEAGEELDEPYFHVSG